MYIQAVERDEEFQGKIREKYLKIAEEKMSEVFKEEGQ